MSEPNPHVLAELSKYLNGQLPGAQRRRVEAHLESCESCRQHHEGLLSLRNLIQETPSLMPQGGFFRKLIPSGLIKAIVVIGLIVLAVWAVRKHQWRQTSVAAKNAPAKPAVVSEPHPVPVETAAPPEAPPADSNVQDLQQLANTLPPPTTATAEPAVPPVAPAVLPDTAPVNPTPPTP